MNAAYLAGPINGATDAEANDWRSDAKDLLTVARWTWLDPMDRDYRGREDECVNEIVELDKADIDNSEVMIAYCPKPSVGTSMEVFYCWDSSIPVVVIVPPGSPCSPWLRYHATKVVSTVPEAITAALELVIS